MPDDNKWDLAGYRLDQAKDENRRGKEMRLNENAVILDYQVAMIGELIKLWKCDKARFLEIEKKYNLFEWIRNHYEYLQGFGDRAAAEDITEYVREQGGFNDQ